MWQLTDSTPREFRYYQFGLQRTGTTIIDRIIRDNWNYWKANDAEQNLPKPFTLQPQPDTVWKHAIDIPPNYDQNAPTILVYKSPYTWAESMAFRRGLGNGAWNQSWGHEHLNLYPQPKPGWNNVTMPGQGTVNIGQIMYVYKHWFNTWLPFVEEHPDNTVLIKYEDLLVDEKRNEIFKDITTKFGWDIIENPTMPKHVGSSQPMDQERIDYYLKGRPTQEMFYQHGRRYLNSINDILGHELITRLGYEFL
jgi:hypothetical protein